MPALLRLGVVPDAGKTSLVTRAACLSLFLLMQRNFIPKRFGYMEQKRGHRVFGRKTLLLATDAAAVTGKRRVDRFRHHSPSRLAWPAPI